MKFRGQGKKTGNFLLNFCKLKPILQAGGDDQLCDQVPALDPPEVIDLMMPSEGQRKAKQKQSKAEKSKAKQRNINKELLE